MPRTMLGHYEIIESLGKGGMGEVYRARDTYLERDVALKVLTGEFDERLLARFDREAKLLATVNHPNIASIYSIEHERGKPFLVLELVDGESLSNRLAARRMPLHEALGIGRQIASALAAAHARRVIHRDLKPANLMVTPHGLVKLLDFGIAKAVDVEMGQPAVPPAEQSTCTPSSTTAGLVLGTVPYMSPEQVRGRPLDARTDIWSFACVLYEMLAGKAAFQRATVGDTLAAVIECDVDWVALPPDTPPAIRSLLQRCLQVDLSKRVQHADEVSADIEEALSLFPSSTSATSHGAGTRAWAWVAAVVALVVAILWPVGTGFDRSESLGSVDNGASARLVPLTTLLGSEEDPALSPDARLVAFTWDRGRDAGVFDLYVQQIGTADPLRLTDSATDVAAPAWAPDGGEIAFLRRFVDRWNVEVMPPLGGPPRTVGAVSGVTFAGLSYSPTGKQLALVHRPDPQASESIFLMDRDTGELTPVSHPERAGEGDREPVFSPDGELLAFVRWHELPRSEIYVSDLSGNARLLAQHDGFVQGLAWLPDGSGLVFCSVRAGVSRLWRVDLRGRSAALGFGDGAHAISIAADALVYARHQEDTNLWIAPGPAATQPTPARRLIASTRDEWAPTFSPDGRRIAFMSDRFGEARVWICDSFDGSNCVELPTGGLASTPRWSPDGSRIAYGGVTNGIPDIRVTRVTGGSPRAVVADPSVNLATGWSTDSAWLYFMSDRTGEYQVWKVHVESGRTVQLTTAGGALPVGSLDNRWVYYLREDEPLAIWRVRTDGSAEAPVFEHRGLTLSGFTVWNTRLLFFLAEPGLPVSAHALDTETGNLTPFFHLPHGVRLGRYGRMSVSPDGKWIVYPQQDGAGSDLMLVRDFTGEQE